MPLVDVNDEKIFYSSKSSDQKRTLLAIHGSGGDHTGWPVALRQLPQANVCAIDLPGHGQSTGHGHDRIAAYADFIEAFAARQDLDDVTLIGHSLGGAIAQLLAVRAPDWLNSIVLVGTGARLKVEPDILNGLLSNFEATIDIVCQWAFGPSASETLISEGREVMLKTPPQVIHGDYRACNQFDLMEKVAAISLPTLVISGAADKLTPEKYGDYLCKNIPAAKHIIIKDAGHMMALEKPEEFTKIIADFLSMPATLSKSALKVQHALEVRGLACPVVEMAKTTRSAKDAARAVGCRVEQIVKSLVFRGKKSRKAFLIVASGVNRVNEKKFAERVGEPVEMPDADFVREKTGFAIGGVPPIAHTNPLDTFIDEDLLNYAEIWAAAGTPRAVFKLTPADLRKITGGQVIKVT